MNHERIALTATPVQIADATAITTLQAIGGTVYYQISEAQPTDLNIWFRLSGDTKDTLGADVSAWAWGSGFVSVASV